MYSTSHISNLNNAKFEYFVRYLGTVEFYNKERDALKVNGIQSVTVLWARIIRIHAEGHKKSRALFSWISTNYEHLLYAVGFGENVKMP